MMRRERNDRMSAAWHTAWLHRVDAKKFPKLKSLMEPETGASSKVRAPDWQNQMAVMQGIFAARRKK